MVTMMEEIAELAQSKGLTVIVSYITHSHGTLGCS